MPAPREPVDPLIGQVIDGRYHVRRVLGRGGMGVVYEAEATRLGRRLCAVKVLLPEFTRSATAVARFSREAELAARVKHPNVVEIFDTGTTPDGRGYIAMELLRGESLDRTLRRDGPLPWPRAQHIIVQICRGLAVAHAEKIVHRDMKPENCFRGERDDDPDFIKVLDFGIAKLTDEEQGEDAPRLTATNSVIGTYAYMAHEQVRGEEIDHRVDVWAVGVMLYEMLTGRLPFRGNNQGQIWTAICNYDPEPMRNVAPNMAIPEPAEAIVRRALARSRDERFPTVEALARAVAGVQPDGSVRPVTGKLALPTLPVRTASLTVASGPTMASESPPRNSRTAPVNPHDLTELGASEVIDTQEHLRTTPGPLTSPGRHTGLARPRELIKTEIADIRMEPAPGRAAISLPAPRKARRAVWLLAGLGLTGGLVTVSLYQGTAGTPTPATATSSPFETPGDPKNTTVANPGPTAPAPHAEPTQVPGPAATPGPVANSEPLPNSEPAAPQESLTKAPGSGPKKPPDPFAVRAARALDRLRGSKKLAACFLDAGYKLPLLVDVKITAAGASTVTVPLQRRGSKLEACIKDQFAATTFPTGSRTYADFVSKGYTLNKQ